jgi:hypothetical protein
MKHILKPVIAVLMALALAACGDTGKDGDNNSGVDATEQAPAAAPLSDEARFDGDMSRQGCELLTPDMVADTFDVPADELKQMKVMGCRYNRDNDRETLEAAISMIRAHKSEAGAAQWFGNATRSRTAEEMKAEMDKVAERMNQSAALDTDAKKTAAQGVMDAVGSKAVTFEDVPGVGDEARVHDEGTVYVRVDNLTFMVSAYHGPKPPPPDLEGVDLQQMANVAMESAAAWAAETAPQRKSDSARLAGAIVESL